MTNFRILIIITIMIACVSSNAIAQENSSNERDFLIHKTSLDSEKKASTKSNSSEKRIEVRIKDIARLDGIRKNQLFGYGLVTGLAGTGDDTNQVKFTAQAIANMLDNMGVKANPNDIRVKNFASVMVTADLPAFAKPGDLIDITVSSMGNAKSLEGGTLILTPLKAANGEIYAVAQGPITLGGFGASTSERGTNVKKNFLTVGRIPNGAIVEREVYFEYAGGRDLTWILREPDFTTASSMAKAISSQWKAVDVKVLDPSSIFVRMPFEFRDNPAEFIADIEQLKVTVDAPSRVVINEKNGTIILGGNVKIHPVSIAHGNISVSVLERIDVSQPEPFSGGSTVVTKQSGIAVTEDQARFVEVTSETLVGALNQLGASAQDIVAIFQAIKAAGALEAELIVL